MHDRNLIEERRSRSAGRGRPHGDGRVKQHSGLATDDQIVSKFSKRALDWRKARPLPCTDFVHAHVHRMKIKAYLKPQCGWSNGVRAILRKHNLPFEDID